MINVEGRDLRRKFCRFIIVKFFSKGIVPWTIESNRQYSIMLEKTQQRL